MELGWRGPIAARRIKSAARRAAPSNAAYGLRRKLTLDRHGSPEIFNSDQGVQFTSAAFTGVLAASGVRISMEGKGRYLDNIFIERLWRSLKVSLR